MALWLHVKKSSHAGGSLHAQRGLREAGRGRLVGLAPPSYNHQIMIVIKIINTEANNSEVVSFRTHGINNQKLSSRNN